MSLQVFSFVEMQQIQKLRPNSKGPSMEFQNQARRQEWDNRYTNENYNISTGGIGQNTHIRQNSKISSKNSVALEPGGIRAKKGSVIRNNIPKQQHLIPESVRSNESMQHPQMFVNDQSNNVSQFPQQYQVSASHIPRIRKGFQIQNINKKSINVGGGVAAGSNGGQQKRAVSRKVNQRPGSLGMNSGGPGAYQQNAISGDVINYLKEELLQTWDSYIIPDYHRTVFLDSIYGLTSNQYLPIIAKEIQDLQQEQAPIQNTIRAIIGRESCLQQIKELDKVLEEAERLQTPNQALMDECVKILHSLRMLTSSHNQNSMHQERNSVNKFKSIPFIWEGENYLLKMKNDAQFLITSEYGKHFNFSTKSDPFLVFPSQKHNVNAVGGGAQGLKSLKKQNSSGNQGQAPASVNMKKDKNGLPVNKLIVPLANSMMKWIRQSEVYLMEEAVTDQILKSSSQSNNVYQYNDKQQQNYQEEQQYIASAGINFSEFEKENASDILNMIQQPQRNEIKAQISQQRYNQDRQVKPDIIDIKTYHNDMDHHQPSQYTVNQKSQNILQYHEDQEQITPISQQIDFFQSPHAHGISSQQPTAQAVQENTISLEQRDIAQQSLEYEETIEEGPLAIFGLNIHEDDLNDEISKYYDSLDKSIKNSFAPINLLIDSMMSGYDPHYLVLKSSEKSQTISGLLAFNVDNMLQKQTQKQLKVNLYHISSVDKDKFEESIDLAIDYIWKNMHCAVIRISIYHYEHENGVLQGLQKEDLMKEPFQFRIQSLIGINENLQQSGKLTHGKDVQSICGVLNNLIQYKTAIYANKTDKMAKIEQLINTNIVQDARAALEKAENLRNGFVLPETNFLVAENLNAIHQSNILRVTDSGQTFSKVVGSQCTVEARFGSIDPCYLEVNDRNYKYMRIKRNPMTFAQSSDFEHIIIISNTEENINMVILIENHDADINHDNMHQKIKNSLNNIQAKDDDLQKIKNIWIPQFKITQIAPQRNQNFEGLVVCDDGNGKQYINECYEQFNLELYAPPISAGTPDIEIRNQEKLEEAFIIDRPFYVAVTHGALEETIESPLLVGFIDFKYWKLL
ncbi:UNKNOWN [Stylonychia lemnae]|uniref:Uncharacterized protein n=1 Tax=Stylonychia lemnae TaxID=5949 RepID=A0A078B4B1_STYLE|nr:UNKNOWN [Stylonychia lemnae]|eukprot:CDW89091.1 UNKNOWN [Stylonychia lemnae]